MSALRVAIQGEPGSYSATAAARLLKGSQLDFVSCRYFKDVFEALLGSTADTALIPLENMLSGSVLQNYDLIRQHNCWITAEIFLPIEHCLIGLPSAELSRIDTVFSHPVALEQCRGFLEQHPEWQIRRAQDTSGSVRQIVERGLDTAAAIASAEAAGVYGGVVLRSGIQDSRVNFTRFVQLKPRREVSAAANKTSIVFSFKNVPGALYKALSVFALRDIDLTKIESRPQPKSTWRYIFYIDFIGRLDDERVRNALNHLAEVAEMLEVLGCYPADDSIRRQFL